MKAVFVGGGSHRLVGILRAALAEPGLFDNGEIFLCDLNVARAEAVGRLLMKTPEFARVGCRVRWGAKLEDGLDGADLVGVVLFAGTPLSYQLGEIASRRRGFISSDNVSPNGAFLAIKGAPILLDVARKMERQCPGAWLLDFANPVAVHSGMINNHTKIKALGVCMGYANHQSDLSRLLGKDVQNPAFDVEAAGINHLSFIVRGSLAGRDLFGLLDKAFKKDWKLPPLQPSWSAGAKQSIRRAVNNLRRFYRELGVLIFSTEPDGMAHLYHDELVAEESRRNPIPTRAQCKASLAQTQRDRRAADDRFRLYLDRDLGPKFWATVGNRGALQPQPRDIFVRIMLGVGGDRPVKVVTSRPNHGAIAGIKDRTVVEYSQSLHGRTIEPAANKPLNVPAVVQGMIGALAEHQTLLGDAIATGDPEMLAHALLAYPIQAYSKNARGLYRELAWINRDQMPRPLQSVDQHL